MCDEPLAATYNSLLCARCDHDMDPHFMLATTGFPLDGGIVLCHVKGCECFYTWAPAGIDPASVPVPSAVELAELRGRLQR